MKKKELNVGTVKTIWLMTTSSVTAHDTKNREDKIILVLYMKTGLKELKKKVNKLEEELQCVQRSKVFCKEELEKEDNPHIQEKIKHYLYGLDKEEKRLLKELRR